MAQMLFFNTLVLKRAKQWIHILAHGGTPKDEVNEGSLGTQCGSHSYIQCMHEGSYKLSHPSHHHSHVRHVKTFLKPEISHLVLRVKSYRSRPTRNDRNEKMENLSCWKPGGPQMINISILGVYWKEPTKHKIETTKPDPNCS
jgi:hypothetical protein